MTQPHHPLQPTAHSKHKYRRVRELFAVYYCRSYFATACFYFATYPLQKNPNHNHREKLTNLLSHETIILSTSLEYTRTTLTLIQRIFTNYKKK